MLERDDVISEGVVTAGRGLLPEVVGPFSALGEGSHGMSILSAVGAMSIGVVVSSLVEGLAGGRGSSSIFELVGVTRASAGNCTGRFGVVDRGIESGATEESVAEDADAVVVLLVAGAPEEVGVLVGSVLVED